MHFDARRLTIDRETVFRVSMWWRILYGAIRILLGLTLLKFIGTPFNELLYTIFQYELVEDPQDLLYMLLNMFTTHTAYTVTYFLAGYLLFWGFIDVLLSIQLLRHVLWAFPVSLTLVGIFIVYELQRLTHTHSLLLATVVVVDMGIMWIMHGEYKRLRAKIAD